MQALVADLRKFQESSISAEDMASFIALRTKLDPDYLSSDAASKPIARGRGRKKQAPGSSEHLSPERLAAGQDEAKAPVRPKAEKASQDTK